MNDDLKDKQYLALELTKILCDDKKHTHTQIRLGLYAEW